MELLDIHTHHLPENPYQAIVSCTPEELKTFREGYYSVGYHPWYLSGYTQDLYKSLSEALEDSRVLALGEAGLDKITETAYTLQEEVFSLHAKLSIERKIPLIIHAVRSYNDIFEIHQKEKTNVPWIIHGFRGKKELAKQFTDHGFYLSLGEHYPEETLKNIPVDKLFFETDDSLTDISEIYRRAAEVLSIPATELIKRVQQNIKDVFFNQ